jgi:hypothetical protein
MADKDAVLSTVMGGALHQPGTPVTARASAFNYGFQVEILGSAHDAKPAFRPGLRLTALKSSVLGSTSNRSPCTMLPKTFLTKPSFLIFMK